MSPNSDPYFSRILKPYCSLPAESGSRDPALLALARTIDLTQPTLFLDYGCGQGRLLAAIGECRAPLELARLHYIGVDLHKDALDKALAYFDSTLASTGARACFLPFESFLYIVAHMLVDQIAVVFAVHEFDPANLDSQLATLWRMLRRGGRLYVQDTAASIHEEVEFLALSPACIQLILEEAGAHVTVQVVTAGRRAVPVYLIEACKPSSMNVGIAYSLPDLAEVTRRTLHRSMLADCLALWSSRYAVDSGETVDSDEVAAVCHRIAVKARAFHQTLAMDEVNSRRADYCVGCGSLDVEVEWLPPNFKDPGDLSIGCKNCGYRHQTFIDNSHDHPGLTQSSLVFLDKGNVHPLVAEDYLRRCLMLEDSRYLDVVLPFLARVPGVTPQLLQRIIASRQK